MNPTLELLSQRRSTRAYTDTPLADAEKDAILNAAFRAPTAGNMMLYSIIDVADPQLKARLAVTCDDQPFIAKAPWVLIFLADFQKWIDLFDACGVPSDSEIIDRRRPPGPGDLLLGCSDALIAAQNAVIAAESLGIGSCYIGDVLERGEEHAELLELPAHTLPIAMLCFGRPAGEGRIAPRYTGHMVHTDRYRRQDDAELRDSAAELQRIHAPHGLKPGVGSYPESIYKRKYTSDFMEEMNRSVAWWLERWSAER